jgi:WD40 repeat protein
MNQMQEIRMNIMHAHETDKAPETVQTTQPPSQQLAQPGCCRSRIVKMILLSVALIALFLAIVLPINSSLNAIIKNTAPTTYLQFSPDGRLLVSETHESTITHAVPFPCIGCRPASYDTRYTVNVWKAASDTLLYSFPASANTGPGNRIGFSPDGRLLATSSTKLTSNPNLWRITLRESQHGTLLRTLAIDQPYVGDFAFSPDGRLLAVEANTFNDPNANVDDSFFMIQIYDVASGALLHTLKGWYAGTSFLFSPDSSILAVGTYPYNSLNQTDYAAIKLYDVASGRLLKSIAPPDSVWADVYQFSTDGHALLVFADSPDGNDYEDIDYIDLASGRTTMSIERKFGHGLSATALNPAQTLFAFSDWNDKSEFASAFYGTGSNTVSLWDAATGKQLRVLEKQSGSYLTSAVVELVFSPDGRLLAGLGADNVIRIWDVATSTLLHTLGGYLSKVRTLAFSPDSRWLVTGSGYTTFHFWTAYTIRIWDVQSGMSIKEL